MAPGGQFPPTGENPTSRYNLSILYEIVGGAELESESDLAFTEIGAPLSATFWANRDQTTLFLPLTLDGETLRVSWTLYDKCYNAFVPAGVASKDFLLTTTAPIVPNSPDLNADNGLPTIFLEYVGGNGTVSGGGASWDPGDIRRVFPTTHVFNDDENHWNFTGTNLFVEGRSDLSPTSGDPFALVEIRRAVASHRFLKQKSGSTGGQATFLSVEVGVSSFTYEPEDFNVCGRAGFDDNFFALGKNEITFGASGSPGSNETWRVHEGEGWDNNPARQMLDITMSTGGDTNHFWWNFTSGQTRKCVAVDYVFTSTEHSWTNDELQMFNNETLGFSRIFMHPDANQLRREEPGGVNLPINLVTETYGSWNPTNDGLLRDETKIGGCSFTDGRAWSWTPSADGLPFPTSPLP